ncbi:MAG TPA: acyl-CoA dehydrogenase family protein [Steroidobacteraceae bacterium]|jgi:acyl-CoA dehydrogenase|nr:acyl-CoA dehydrogenase family protein [Steroidobacteraceae bacterium]
MDFSLSDEQQMVLQTTREFVVNELYPHEKEVEETGKVRDELHRELVRKSIEAGLYAANMPAEVGGAGLDTVTWALYEKELGKANYGLHMCVGRPSNILMACAGEQRERYLLPAVRGERIECLAMTEPGAGSDLRGMKTSAVESGGDYIINGTKHFISHADRSDFVILFAASGEESGAQGARKKKITAFLVDMGTPGFEVRPGYKNVSHRGYNNSILEFNQCRVPKSAILGEPHRGFDVANTWLGSTRLQVAATCLGRAERALDLAKQWAVDRRQFGQQIGKFQGISFKLANMAVELRAAELLVLEAAWKRDQKIDTDMDMAIAKVKSTEMLAMVADEALQIHGGMGLMSDLPLERIWRDARIERIWDGTSEVQRHIISRSMLRPLGG